MKKNILLIAIFFISGNIFAKNPYEKMAFELSKDVENIKTIAVIPFAYATNNKISNDGFIIAERLSTEFVNIKKFKVIERNVLYKVLEELKLQQSGVVDQTMAKEIGKILSVDALVTGTLIEVDDEIEVNARLIRTDTAEVIKATKVKVKKDWGINYSMGETSGFRRLSTGIVGNYFDFLFGFSAQKMDGSFDFDVEGFEGLREINNVGVEGIGPVGIRFVSISKNHFGFNFELSYERYNSKEKNLDNVILKKDYFKTGSLSFSMDFLFNAFISRYISFYFGVGGGIGFDKVSSDYVNDINRHKLDEFSLSFLYRLPVGIRFVKNNITYFAEARYEGHSISFDRGTYDTGSPENNSLDFRGIRYCFGIGIKY
jgi:TolB-like protein